MPKLFGFDPTPIPGPPPARLFGLVPRLLRFLADPIAVLEELRPLGDVVALARDNPALVCVFGPERNRDVLSDAATFQHSEDFVRGRPGTPLGRLSKAIVNINGEAHKRHRRLLTPAFSKPALERYAVDITEVAQRMVQRWPVGEEVDLDELVRDLTLCAAVRTLLGLDLTRESSDIGTVAARFSDALAAPLAILLPYEIPGLPYRKAQRIGDALVARIEELIERKRHGGEADTDALARLIHATDDDRFSDDELIAETTTLFFAGHETTAKTLSWTLFLLDRHPAVLADLLDELEGVLGGRAVTAADIPRLPLLDRVLKESQRLLSSVPLLFLRVPTHGVELGGVRLPQGANVVVSPFATHHDPALYPRPRRFDPDRWIDHKPSLYEYLPFGAGPRLCVGARFAEQAMRLILPTILQHVRPALLRDAEISSMTRANIMRPRFGLPARLHPPSAPPRTPEPIRGTMDRLVDL